MRLRRANPAQQTIKAQNALSFAINTNRAGSIGTYFRLEKFESTMEKQGIALKQGIETNECDYRFDILPYAFLKIPGTPFAYWASVLTHS